MLEINTPYQREIDKILASLKTRANDLSEGTLIYLIGYKVYHLYPGGEVKIQNGNNKVTVLMTLDEFSRERGYDGVKTALDMVNVELKRQKNKA